VRIRLADLVVALVVLALLAFALHRVGHRNAAGSAVVASATLTPGA
jgi:hypothetical protein